ncbi:hypothetical protein ACSNOI_26920 [Actinomadura kijaniata]|uniref:hypothetical protein n=1 Tax=Actinomadura kijaniata TaxID=46161 RepID=UPI003F1B7359
MAAARRPAPPRRPHPDHALALITGRKLCHFHARTRTARVPEPVDAAHGLAERLRGLRRVHARAAGIFVEGKMLGQAARVSRDAGPLT